MNPKIVLVLAFVFGALAACPWDAPGLQRWSSWPNRPKTANDNATIASNEKILFDVSAEFNSLQIQGQLIFLGTVGSLTMTANTIFVGPDPQATFVIGSKDCEYTNQAIVLLKGSPTRGFDGPFGAGTKCLATVGGQIDIWGKVRTPTWTQLNAHATAGATSITLAQDVDWQVGEKIVITTTDFEDIIDLKGASSCSQFCAETQNEVRVITARPNARTVSFGEPLKFNHYGALWTNNVNQDSIDLRGEVGLLSRNVIIRGDDDSENTLWGGHTILNGQGQLRISYSEFFFVGQAGEKGRYPYHLHRAGEQQGTSFAVGNSFHNSYQRAVTLHGANHAKVALNVAFNVTGHVYFIEDGNEQANVFERNLGVFARQGSLLVSDSEPSIFWITNPANHFYNNVAVGGKFGFWYAIPVHPLGFAVQNPDTRFLRFLPSGDFKGNRAHSNTDSGLFVDRGLENDGSSANELTSYNPVDSSKTLPLLKDPVNYLNNGDFFLSQLGVKVIATFTDFTAYKTIQGIWFRGANLRATGCKVADVMLGFSGPGQGMLVDDCIFVGESDNVGNLNQYSDKWWPDEGGRNRFFKWWRSAPIVGYRSYDAAGGDIAMDNRFYSFKDVFLPDGKLRYAGAISGQIGPNVISPRNRYFRNIFIQVQRRFYLYDYTVDNNLNDIPLGFSDTAMNGHVTVDADGSITGICGASLLGFSPLLNQPLCNKNSNNANNGVTANTVICQDSIIPHRHVSIFGGGGQSQTLPVSSQLTGALYRTNDQSSILIRPEGVTDLGNGNANVLLLYNTNVVPNQEYFFGLVNNIPSGTSNTSPLYTNPPSGPFTLPNQFTVGIDSIAQGEFIRIALPMNIAPASVTGDFDNHPLTSVNSKNLLNRDTFFFDIAAKLLWVELSITRETVDWFFGVPSLSSGYFVTITMGNCASTLCSGQTATLPPAGPAPVSGSSTGTLCMNGPVKGGQMVFTPSNNNRFDIIANGALNPQWLIAFLSTGVDFNVNSTFAFDSVSKTATGSLPNFGGFFAARQFNLNTPTLIAPFTHLEISMKIAPGQVENSFGVKFSNLSFDTKDILLDHPKYTSGPINDQQFTKIVIPLADFGFPTTNFDLRGMYFFNAQARPVNFIIDHISLVTGTVSIQPIPGWPPRPPVAALVGPGPSFDPLPVVVAASASFTSASLFLVVCITLIFY